MLKKISVGEVRLGMHLHALCGPWLDHPFWKSSFVLRVPAELDKLRTSNVSECWIDTSKGLDVEHPCATIAARIPEPSPIDAPVLAARPSTRRPEPSVPTANATSMEEELHRAAELFRRSRQAVQSLLSEARMGRAVDVHGCLPLVSDIAASVWRNFGALVSLARLKTHDDYSYMHSVAVCALMVTLSRQLGHAEDQVREAGLAGLLHDIGKVKMPLDLLNKPSKLTGTEYEVMKGHPLRGHHLLRESAGTTELALDVCLHHHERPDGRGYPYGLAGA
jgi:HD-GYP domain-containing protein (c-di-GMP phosphodiesterase class II)